jgi:hypothetical protein
MKHKLILTFGMGLLVQAHSALPERPAGNPWYGALRYGYPLGPSLEVGRLLPQQKNHCEAGDFGNLCFGPALELEAGLSGARAGLGWAFVGNYGRLGGLGLYTSAIWQTPELFDKDLGLGTPPERLSLGSELSLAVLGINLRVGPYWALNDHHKGDFLGRLTIGYGF